MRALLLKDFYLMRNGMFTMLLVWGVLGLWAGTAFSLWLVLAFLPISVFYEDEVSGWERLQTTLPVSDRDVVLSRYIGYYILFFISISLVYTLTVVSNFIYRALEIDHVMMFQMGELLFVILVVAVQIPVLFELGYVKATSLFCFAAVGIMGLGMFLWIPLSQPSVMAVINNPVVVIVVGVVSQIVSIKISVRDYGKRRFDSTPIEAVIKELT